jgi:DUF4097 and DUF4098 domain-containing protein YvlB
MHVPLIFSVILLIISHSTHAFSWQDVTAYFNSHKEDLPIKKEFAVNTAVLVELEGISGDVTVKGWNKSVLALEAIKKGPIECLDATNIRITVSPQTVTLATTAPQEKPCSVRYNLMVPRQASLKIHLKQQGNITVHNVEGTLSVKTYQGNISLEGTVGNSTAKTTYGTIDVIVKELPSTSSLFLETFKGSVALTVPKTTNASLAAKTITGTVTSDIPLTLACQTITLNRQAWARCKKEAVGTFGNGGAPVTIEATKGNVTISGH